jgi:hypothetical protein
MDRKKILTQILRFFAAIFIVVLGFITIIASGGGGGGDGNDVIGAGNPTITGFTPASGQVGDTVTITGTNFSATPTNNTVNFNGTAAVVTSSTTTQIVTTVPTDAATGPITVAVSNKSATSSSPFTITLFSPLDITLSSQNFWEFSWDYYYSSAAQGGGGSSSTDNGKFWVVLGQATQIEGVTAYEVLTYGKSKSEDKNFGPRWKYMAIGNNKIFGSIDGTTLTTIFDTVTGKWVGGGFFTTFPASTLSIAQNGTISTTNDYIDGPAIVVQRSASQSQCEYFSDYGTICGDSSYDYKEYEYYSGVTGPTGYYYYNSYFDWGGGFGSGATWEHNAGLTASSFTGQTNPLTNEVEPNDSPATARQVTLTSVIIGTVSQSALANVGNTLIPGIFVVDPTVEDWYRFTMASAGTVTITLSFQNYADADLDLYLMNSTGTDLAASNSFSGDDNLLTTHAQLEYIQVIDLPAGTYTIGVDGYATPAGPVEYTLQLE